MTTPMNLESDRLLLRPVNSNDKDEIFNYRSDREANKYQGWIPKTPGDVDSFITTIAKQINEPGTWFQFSIIEKKTNLLIGDLGVHFWDKENKQVEIGCTLNRRFQKNGYATESVRLIIDYLFTELKKHRIIASVDPQNLNSIRLVERIGFRKEAHFVESLFVNGEWVDDLIYSLIEKDWNLLTTKNNNR